jgi:hypothetical protein
VATTQHRPPRGGTHPRTGVGHTPRIWVGYTPRIWVGHTPRIWVGHTPEGRVVQMGRLQVVQSGPAADIGDLPSAEKLAAECVRQPHGAAEHHHVGHLAPRLGGNRALLVREDG